MKIAHVVGKLKAAGVESVVFTYLRFMDKTGLEIHVLYDSDSSVAPPQDLADAGIRFIEIPPYQKIRDYMKVLTGLFRTERYDIVHSHMNALSALTLRAAKRAGVKHRIAHNHSTSSRAELTRDVAKTILKPFARRYATDYAACSIISAEWMFGSDAIVRGKVKIFNNAINIDRFRFSESGRAKIRDELGISGKFAVGHIGRFMSQKNHKFLIDIFAEIKKIRDDAVLILAGEGELVGEIKKKVSEKGLSDSVIFCGIVPDPWDYYSAFDVFLLPSLYEGLPVVALEAQASGLSVIASDAVTRECDVSSVRFLSLSDSAEEWAKAAVAAVGRDRNEGYLDMKDSDYDISRSAKDMREYYFEIIKK